MIEIEDVGREVVRFKDDQGKTHEVVLDVWNVVNELYKLNQEYMNKEEPDHNEHHAAIKRYFIGLGFPDFSDYYFLTLCEKIQDRAAEIKKGVSADANAKSPSSTELRHSA